MSSDPRKPDDTNDDRDLDAFLRGEDATSRAYNAARDVQPPADLDTAILNFARASARTHHTRSRLRRWQRPLALAAVLMLSMGVLLQLWKEPAVRNPVEMRQAPATSAMSSPEQEAVIEPLPQPARKAAPAPPPPAAAAAAATEQAARQSIAPEMSSEPAPTMGASTDASADSAASAKSESVPQERRRAADAESVQRSFALRKEQPRAAAAAQYAEPKKLDEKIIVWRAPIFDTLQLGQATQADVRARYGEPSSQGLSSPDDKNADRRELRYDTYTRLPGQTGLFEFYYERSGLRLLSVRRVLTPAVNAQTLIAELGWKEAPLVTDWQHPPCEATEFSPAAKDARQPALHWLYEARGAYFYLTSSDRVGEVIYQARCE